jgi:hypothetical protein
MSHYSPLSKKLSHVNSTVKMYLTEVSVLFSAVREESELMVTQLIRCQSLDGLDAALEPP